MDSIGSPGGDASAKKVLVFGPDGTVESKCGSDHGPICDISRPNALLDLACGEGAVSLLPEVFELAEEFVFADVVGLEEVAEVLGGFVELDQGDEVLDPVVVGWGRAG